MGVADAPPVTWSDVQSHVTRKDQWIVIEGGVYDVSGWASRHPGGSRVIHHYAGEDATEAFRAFHPDLPVAKKYLRSIQIGTLQDRKDDKHERERNMQEDFETLRQTATKMGLFRPSLLFYTLSILQLVVLDVLAYWLLYTYGTGWLPWVASLLALTVMQAQAGWIQHDYGHNSVFASRSLNQALHQYTLGFTMGFSSSWWNHLHNQHHAKPNVLHKDPDVRLEAVFVLGQSQALRVARTRSKSMPYDWQHHYFFAIAPPLLFPVYFQFVNFRHCIVWRKWLDLAVMLLYYVRFFYLYIGLLGFWPCIGFYFLVRCFQSHWFVWVSQANHIPMQIAEDKQSCWLPLQLAATCDIYSNWFNDWFTGHLNLQIEHHLFPTMPRHNLHKVVPLVKALCHKHDVPHCTKPLLTAFSDIIRALKSSGKMWSLYYKSYHPS